MGWWQRRWGVERLGTYFEGTRPTEATTGNTRREREDSVMILGFLLEFFFKCVGLVKIIN